MGTYTTNYNLFMPTVGETGWGDLVNGNFATIDTTMKGLDTRIETLENVNTVNYGQRVTITDDGNNRTISSTSMSAFMTNWSLCLFNGVATNSTIGGTLYLAFSSNITSNYKVMSISNTGSLTLLVNSDSYAGVVTIPSNTQILQIHSTRTQSGNSAYTATYSIGSYTLTYE